MAATLGIATLETQVDLSGMKRGLDSGQRETQSWLSKAGSTVAGALGSVVKYGVIAATGAMVAFGVTSVKAASDLQAQMSGVQAVLQATNEETQLLKDEVMNLSVDPNLKVSAVEAADAMEMLAKNGMSASQILGQDLTRSVIALDNATGSRGMAQSADILTDTLALWKDQADDVAGAVDGITAVTVASKFSIDDYALALAQGGGVAATVGVSFNDFNTTIAAISPLFKSGSDAGTSFKTFLQRLVPASDKAQESMGELGLLTAEGTSAFFDATGQMKDMTEVSSMLYEATKDLSDEQKNMYLSSIFGADALRAAAGLAAAGAPLYETAEEAARDLGLSLEDLEQYAEGGITQYEALQASMGNTDAMQQAAMRIDNLSGDIEIFKSILQGLSIQFGDVLLPFLRTFVQLGSNLLSTYGPTLVGVFQTLIGVITSFAGNLQEGMGPLDAFIEAIWNIAPPSVLDALTQLRDQILPNLFALFEEYIQPVIDFVASFVEWKDVLLVLGVAIMGVVLPALWAIASPFLAIGALIAAGILLVAALRTAWEQNFLGIQDLVGGVWQAIQVGWMAFQALFEGNWENFLFRIGIAWQVAWNAITEFVNNIWVIIEPYLTQFYNDFIAWWEAIDWYAVGENVANYLVDGITLAGQLIGLVILKFTELYTAVVEWFKTQDWETAGNAVTDKITAVWEGFSSVISPILQGWWDAFVTWFEGVEWQELAIGAVNTLIDGYASFVDKVWTTLEEWEGAFIDWVNNADWEGIATTATETIIDGLIDFIESVVPTLQEWYGAFNDWVLEQDWEAIAKGIVGGIIYLLSGQWATDIVSSVKEWYNSTDDEVGKIKWSDIGGQIVAGVMKGLTDKAGDLIAAATEMARNAWRSAKETLGIESPSKVFAELGRFIVQGMIVGIEDEEATLYDKIKSVASSLSGTFNGIVTGIKNFSLKPLEKEIEKTEDLLQGATANANRLFEELALNPDQLDALRTQRNEVRNLQDQINKYKNLELGASLTDAERQIVLKNLQADLKDSVTALETLKNNLNFRAFDELSRQEQISQYFAALKTGNTELANAIQHVWGVQNELNGATAEYEERQATIAKLQEKQQQFAFLQSQLDLINQLAEAGLNPDEILNGITLGLDASEDDLLAAMTATIEALIAQAEGVLGIASPSKVFAKIGQFTGEGLAEGINQTFGLVNRAADSLVNSIIPTDAPQLATNTPPTRSTNGGDTYIITIEKGATITESDVRNIFEKVRRSEGRRVDVSRRQ